MLEDTLQLLQEKQDKELNKFERNITMAIERLNNLIVANALNDIKDPLLYDKLISDYMAQSGYYAAINELVDNGFDVIYTDVLSAFTVAGTAITFTAEDVTKIQAIKQLSISRFGELTSSTQNKMKESLYKYSLSNADQSSIISGIKEALQDSDLVKYSSTYANTLISDYTQSIIDLKSKDADGVWIYTGADDKKTRPFCRCLLDQKKYYDDSNKSNIQGDKRRAYNCRHIMLLVSQDYAIENGYTDGVASC